MAIALKRSSELHDALLEAYGRHLTDLGGEAMNDMAYRSYLFGNALSRYVFWKKLEYVVAAAELEPHQTILDFGCGSGILLPTLCDAGHKVIATDLRLEPAKYLSKKMGLEQVSFVGASEWQYQIGEQSLDVIIAANVLEHVDDRKSIFKQFANKLAGNGRLVISRPTENTLYKLGRRIVGFSGEYHVAAVQDVLEDAHAVGFKQVLHREWPLPRSLCLYQIAAFKVN